MRPAPPRALAALALATLLLAGCAAPPPAGPTDSGAPGAAPLRIGTEAAFPPFEDIDPATGQVVGFDADLARAVAAHLKRLPDFRNLRFDALIPSLQGGQVDMAISAMTITDERKLQVDFSLPYYEANQSVAVRAAETGIRGPDDLAGRRAGVQLGTTGEQWLVDNMVRQGKMTNASVLRYDSFPLAVEALKRGDVDAVMMDAPAVKEAVRAGGGSIRLAFEVATGERYGIAVAKGDTALLLAINDALRALVARGELQRLEDRWGV